MIGQTFIDVTPFLVFFSVFILFFSLMLMIMKVKVDEDGSEEKYVNVQDALKYII